MSRRRTGGSEGEDARESAGTLSDLNQWVSTNVSDEEYDSPFGEKSVSVAKGGHVDHKRKARSGRGSCVRVNPSTSPSTYPGNGTLMRGRVQLLMGLLARARSKIIESFYGQRLKRHAV